MTGNVWMRICPTITTGNPFLTNRSMSRKSSFMSNMKVRAMIEKKKGGTNSRRK
jgi:hypothetical protein